MTVPRIMEASTHTADHALSFEAQPAARLPEVELAAVKGIDASGRLVVALEGRSGGRELPALCATEDELCEGDTVTVGFLGGDPARPVVLGKLRAPRLRPAQGPAAPAEELLLEADRQLTLRCGKASLILTRSGKVLLRGAYVSSHSSGVNRIKGGSVQVN